MTAPGDVTIEQVTADFATYASDVTAKVGDVTAQNVILQQELAAAIKNGTVPVALQTAINDLDASVKAADAAVATPVVAVPEPPAV